MTDVPSRRPCLRVLPFLLVAGSSAMAAEPSVPPAAVWENVSAAFTQRIQADHLEPSYLCRCQGMAVTPSGEVYIQTANQGICVSRNQGASWSVVPGSRILGRSEHGFTVSMAYPYDGRMAFFCYDGKGGSSGGLTLDGAATWQPFAGQVARGTEFGDVDWSVPHPTTIYAMTHEPYFFVVSTDAGGHWHRLEEDHARSCVGVVSAHRFVRYRPAGSGGVLELSQDAGRTWVPVSHDYRVQGRRLVHFGQHLYWTTAQGVIVSDDGEHWSLTGPGARGALYGPYFGAREQDAVVLTSSAFLATSDGGKSWRRLAHVFVPPDIFHGWSGYAYFGWDAAHGILYASGLGASVYRLRLPRDR